MEMFSIKMHTLNKKPKIPLSQTDEKWNKQKMKQTKNKKQFRVEKYS